MAETKSKTKPIQTTRLPNQPKSIQEEFSLPKEPKTKEEKRLLNKSKTHLSIHSLIKYSTMYFPCEINDNKNNSFSAEHTPPQEIIDPMTNFLNRMMKDLNRRRTKEERRKLLSEKSKVRHTETEIVNGFNRLIDDANRRIEVRQKIEEMKNSWGKRDKNDKTYDTEKWKEIYENRFGNYLKNSREKTDKIRKEKEDKQKNELEEYEKMMKNKTIKCKNEVINKICQRLYNDGRKIPDKKVGKTQQQQKQDNGVQFNNNNNDNKKDNKKKNKKTTTTVQNEQVQNQNKEDEKNNTNNNNNIETNAINKNNNDIIKEEKENENSKEQNNIKNPKKQQKPKKQNNKLYPENLSKTNAFKHRINNSKSPNKQSLLMTNSNSTLISKVPKTKTPICEYDHLSNNQIDNDIEIVEKNMLQSLTKPNKTLSQIKQNRPLFFKENN